MNVDARVNSLRTLMRERGIDAFIVPSDDNHGSEYVSEYFRAREWVTGFTGSAGTAVITLEEAHLWTDGRYFLQGAKEIEGTSYILEKLGEPGVKNHVEWLADNLQAGSTVAFNGKVFTVAALNSLKSLLSNKNINIKAEEDLFEKIWTERPSMPKGKMFIHELKYTGKSLSEKLAMVREEMKKEGISDFILASLDDIAWLLNLRGADVPCNPVFLSYLLMNDNGCTLYIDKDKVTQEINKYLEENNVNVKGYEEIVSDIVKIDDKAVVTYDPTKTNVWIKDALSGNVKVVERRNITTDLKARKNEAELSNIENAMVKDGVAMVKFFNWLKKNIGKTEITEITAADKLTQFRSEGEGFVDISFSTISGYGPNGAIIHYHATEENHSKLEPKSLYLIDSGAQYLDGTTDITRTLALGELTEEEMVDYTLVLKGNISLSMAKFLYGIAGCNLDILARKPMWDRGIDYKHGTGHGIGYLLNVHEGPQGIRKEISNVALEKGMLISNEPGIYREGKHGIRLENIVAVNIEAETEFGRFMKFDVLTYCPFELEAIKVELLSSEEKQWLNNYHELVYNKLEGYLNDEEKAWLREATRAI
ncbi:aminopeptidase P family protein [Clostridium sp. UBA4548]|uniref:aminopeptidase P family protein n=1 Tax=Clostridium sp. UBA4548 TaxID=1946361 RepID=UPI0025B8A057|nr:aminopeptidase P family protein [Clostridium sp. UBA4548]